MAAPAEAPPADAVPEGDDDPPFVLSEEQVQNDSTRLDELALLSLGRGIDDRAS